MESEWMDFVLNKACECKALFSEAPVASSLLSEVLIHLAIKLEEHLLWLLEVFPWALGTDIKSTVWVGGPAVESSVPVVVWVCVVGHLDAVVAVTEQETISLSDLRSMLGPANVPEEPA